MEPIMNWDMLVSKTAYRENYMWLMKTPRVLTQSSNKAFLSLFKRILFLGLICSNSSWEKGNIEQCVQWMVSETMGTENAQIEQRSAWNL